MRVDFSLKAFVRFNGLTIQRVQNVVQPGPSTADGLSLTDANSRGSARDDDLRGTYAISFDKSRKIFDQMVIIIPTKNEPVDRLIGVISAIPEGILTILVSNSTEDRYKEEVNALHAHCKRVGNRVALAIHQKDPGAGEAFEAVGTPDLTDDDHKIRNGKGEGMLLGLALAAMCQERKYVGFIDSDNTVPCSAAEYCDAFAMGFYMHQQEQHTMVRIRWPTKPKAVRNRLDYPTEGRSSRIVNKWFNRMFSLLPNSSSATNIGGLIQTGNAGEHAMTMKLALRMNWAGGYAVEPYQIMCLLDLAGASAHKLNGMNGLTNGNSYRHAHQAAPFSAKVVQIKTVNPHIHSPGNDEHIRGMIMEGLGCMYHRLPPPPSTYSRASNGYTGDWQAQFRSEILASLEQEGLPRTAPPAPRVYKSLDDLDLEKLHSIMLQSCRTLKVIGPFKMAPLRSQNGHT